MPGLEWETQWSLLGRQVFDTKKVLLAQSKWHRSRLWTWHLNASEIWASRCKCALYSHPAQERMSYHPEDSHSSHPSQLQERKYEKQIPWKPLEPNRHQQRPMASRSLHYSARQALCPNRTSNGKRRQSLAVLGQGSQDYHMSKPHSIFHPLLSQEEFGFIHCSWALAHKSWERSAFFSSGIHQES